MYNRYLDHRELSELSPQPEPRRTQRAEDSGAPSLSASGGELAGSISQLIGGLTRHFSLSHLDTGDILLVLIILLLYLVGDNLELVITLGLMLLLGLGDE